MHWVDVTGWGAVAPEYIGAVTGQTAEDWIWWDQVWWG